MMKMRVKDEASSFINRMASAHVLNRSAWRALSEVGDIFEQTAYRYVPVDTGALRHSFTRYENPEALYIRFTAGEGLRYAWYVEMGTSRNRPQPYFSPAEHAAVEYIRSGHVDEIFTTSVQRLAQ